MPAANVKHNKKNNIGLIYELLIRNLSQAFVEQNQSKITSIMGILKRHFLGKSALAEENNYYSAAISTKCENTSNARRILETLIKHHKKHSPKRLEEARLALLNDIGHKLNTKLFWSYPLDPTLYKALASAYKVLHYTDSDVKLEGALDLARAKSFIVEQMTVAPAPARTLEEFGPAEDGIVDPLLLTRYYQLYNAEYTKQLNENQRGLLTAYYAYLNNKDAKAFNKTIEEAREALHVSLKRARNNQVLQEAPDKTQKNFYDALRQYETNVLAKELKEENYEELLKSMLLYEGLLIELQQQSNKAEK